jgi:hypothetical protein
MKGTTACSEPKTGGEAHPLNQAGLSPEAADLRPMNDKHHGVAALCIPFQSRVNRNSRACFCYFAFGGIMVTGRELWENIDSEGREYTEVSNELTGTWRWGTCHSAVYKRECDGTHWMMQYQVQTGEGIQWDSVTVSQVELFEETVVVKKWKPLVSK